jgi:anti-sigma B factor antagonist
VRLIVPMAWKLCYAIRVPPWTHPSYAAAALTKLSRAASVCISFGRAWIVSSIGALATRMSFGWSNISSLRRSRERFDYQRRTSVQISARHSDSTTIFDISGDIDLANSPEVRKALLREVREKRTPRVVMNLSKVRYIDSSGVASLVEGLKASRDLNLRFILFGLSPSAREVLQLSRLLKIFEVYDNEDQALSS